MANDESDIFDVEKILSSRKKNGVIQYEVKWDGYDETTWEVFVYIYISIYFKLNYVPNCMYRYIGFLTFLLYEFILLLSPPKILEMIMLVLNNFKMRFVN